MSEWTGVGSKLEEIARAPTPQVLPPPLPGAPRSDLQLQEVQPEQPHAVPWWMLPYTTSNSILPPYAHSPHGSSQPEGHSGNRKRPELTGLPRPGSGGLELATRVLGRLERSGRGRCSPRQGTGQSTSRKGGVHSVGSDPVLPTKRFSLLKPFHVASVLRQSVVLNGN